MCLLYPVDDVVDESDDNDETEADTENDTENEEDEKYRHSMVNFKHSYTLHVKSLDTHRNSLLKKSRYQHVSFHEKHGHTIATFYIYC